MDTLKILLTKRPAWNLPSTVIRLALPQTFFHLARSSHSLVVDGDHALEARMLWIEGRQIRTGVRRVPLEEALSGATVTQELNYQVPDAPAGLAWGREMAEKRVPYDFKGAAGLSIEPDRNWQEEDKFFCHEFSGTVIHKSGLILFPDCGHLTERELMATRFAYGDLLLV